MKHYTYIMQYEDGTLYHGVHSDESLNNNYVGSSKHTPDSIVAKHICSTHNTRDEANSAEMWYHSEYDVKNNLDYMNRMNSSSITFCTQDIAMNEATKQKIRDARKGSKHSEETKAKISANHHDTSGKNNPMFGKKHSIHSRLKMSTMANPKWQMNCPHCDITMDKGNYTRYHGDNCITRRGA